MHQQSVSAQKKAKNLAKILIRTTVAGVLISALTSQASAQSLPANVTLESIVSAGLTQPIVARFPKDGSGRMFILEKGGALKIFKNGALNAAPFLTNSASTSCNWAGSARTTGFSSTSEQGLLGLAFDPNFVNNRRIFLHYNDVNQDTVIAKVLASAVNPDLFEANSCEILLRIDQPFGNHKGGSINFAADGLLYIGMGDGGSGGDPCRRSQTVLPGQLAQFDTDASCQTDANFTSYGPGNNNSRALLGKFLRIDVNGTSAAPHGLCGVPAAQAALFSAPSSNSTIVGQCPEMFAYGIRNPWQWNFDRNTGDLVIGDVGQSTQEEIHVLKRDAAGQLQSGLNFGWNCWEGVFNHSTSAPFCGALALAQTHDPVINLPRSQATSITGGTVYRGPIAGLRGQYVFADFSGGNFFLAQPGNLSAGGTVQADWPYIVRTAANFAAPTPSIGTFTSFTEDTQGNLYVVDAGGQIFKFTDNDSLFYDGAEPF